MDRLNILTVIALGAGLNNAWHVFWLLYNAMYSGNKDGVWSINCNKYGEGNLEVGIALAVFFITLYIFIIQLNKLV